jgi:uncharacterized membrane protein YgaE (UPF0421/DUF939 family)
LFFESLAKRRETNYKVSNKKFESIAKLITKLLQIFAQHRDWDSMQKIVYYTQYFCTPLEQERRCVWMAEKMQELPETKELDFWKSSLNKLIYVRSDDGRKTCCG